MKSCDRINHSSESSASSSESSHSYFAPVMTTAMSDDQPERADALSPVLVIGYGNDLRSDDGAGRHAAARIDALSIPGVRIVSVHQLAPEISDLLASAKMAIFVDAYPADEGSKIRVEKLASSAPAPGFGHFATPGELLSFAEILYRRQPDAWIVAIPGVSFDFGESLSPTTESGVNDATIIIQELIEQHTQSV